MDLRERQADGLRVGRIQCCSILEKSADKGARTRQMQRASGVIIVHYIQCRITDTTQRSWESAHVIRQFKLSGRPRARGLHDAEAQKVYDRPRWLRGTAVLIIPPEAEPSRSQYRKLRPGIEEAWCAKLERHVSARSSARSSQAIRSRRGKYQRLVCPCG
jgi:hypothetical protein